MLKEIINKKDISTMESFLVAKDIYKSNVITFLIIIMIAYFPINLFITVLNFKVFDLNINPNILTDPALMEQFALSASGQIYVLYNIIANLIVMFFKPIGTMAIALVARDYIYGHSTSFGSALKKAFSKGIIFIPATVFYCLMIFSGSMLFVIPGIYIMITFYFYLYSIILEDKNVMSCLRQSYLITKGAWFKTAIKIALIMLASYLLSYGVNILFSWGNENFIIQVISRTFSSYFDCILVIVLTVIYMNRVISSPNVENPVEPTFEEDDDIFKS